MWPGRKKLSILPGSGWDNLVNEERGLTTNREVYKMCRTSDDGNYLIPDGMTIEPIKSTQIELSSKVFTHFTNYTSLTAFSMNSAADVKLHFVSVGGDFSLEKDVVRKAENQNNGLTVRSQLRHRWYIVHQLPDSQLHPRFRNRLLDIAAHLARSNITEAGGSNDGAGVSVTDLRSLVGRNSVGLLSTPLDPLAAEENRQVMFRVMDSLHAAYLADLIVRDFGTHTVVAVEAGAVVAKIDSLTSSSRDMSDKDKLEAGTSASASFASLFDFKTSTKLGTDQKMVEAYNSKVASSFILSYGGPSLKASDMNLTEWERNLANHLVAVDRRGRPIYDLITPRALPELSESLTFRLAAAVKAAVVRYYEANSLIGCLDPASTAYDSDANVAADNCDDFPYQDQTTDVQGGQLPLGGVYTTCKGPSDLCSRHIAPNLATGNTSCPRGFMPVGLLPPQVRSCAVACQDRKVFQEPLCVHECAVTRAFWCALDPSTETDGKNELGFLFGGIYTDTTMNPITKAQSCPPYYEVQSVGRRIQLCLSTDFEMGRRYSLAFGGFYTCQSGNPLYDVLSLNSSSLKRVQQVRRGLHAGLKIGHSDYNGSTSGEDPGIIWSKRCPNGYTSHMAAIEDTCLINCCIPGNSLKVVKERTLKRPPFVQLPDFASIETPLDLQKSLNQPLRLVDTYSGRTYHNQEGEWVPDEAAAEPVNTSASAFLIFAVVMLVILFVVVMGFIIHYAYRRVACSRQQGPFNPTEDSTA
ncbi:Macrophage-expressed gene 1 protein [Echinococcus granulosus]|uniref:Macrophage-expressed gene 1 protein n=1 Tax=Echinococcus granulosus TaxID=6210 RepID=W6UNH1_ECHGR|nr:Macrophage-expressed gene 1 protein [Echinococcus granulosus]EUB62738.1 Macrophage-expressed gene 1 protein [Echinococcus granulosus]